MPLDFEDLASDAFEEIKHSLSTQATYIVKSTGQRISIRGPFDDRVQEVDPDTEVAVSSNVYTFGLKLADIPKVPEKGDKLLIKKITYVVIQAQEDGAPGVSTVLVLHKVNF